MRIYFLFIGLIAGFYTTAQVECFENKTWPMPQLSEAAQKIYATKLAEARQEYEKDSMNAEAILWLGRREAYPGNYKKAIDVFTRGIALHPNDARFYRHRGHRYITLRCFDKAIEDLEKAATLIEGQPDETEPDGIPNEKNTPVSTLRTNTYYHLGLAYFLIGQYEKAEKAYYRGIVASKNDDMLVAMVNWLYITELSQGKTEEAENFFAIVPRTPKLIENGDYLSLLYYYVHNPAENEIERYTNTLLSRTATGKDSMSVGAATLFFGAGYYARLKGMPEKAKLFFEKAMATKQWSSFGYIAAEAEIGKLLYSNVNAQTNVYIENSTLGKFEGTWQWVSGSDTVKILLRKEKVVPDPSSSFALDVIIGYHIYKKGSLVVEDSYVSKDILPSRIYRSMGLNNRNGGDTLTGSLRQLKHPKKNLTLKVILDPSQTALIWHSSPFEGPTVNELPGFILPRDMILIKQ